MMLEEQGIGQESECFFFEFCRSFFSNQLHNKLPKIKQQSVVYSNNYVLKI